MIKVIFILFCFFVLTRTTQGQAVPSTNDLAKRYAKDTWGFRAYPKELLLAKIVPVIKCNKLEINIIDPPAQKSGEKPPRRDYRNIFRYPDSYKKNDDTTVLSECNLSRPFLTCWCPVATPWYMSAKTIDNKIVTIADTATMKRFLGNTVDKFNACLWLYLYDTTLNIPDDNSRLLRYKKVADGLLIRYRTLISAGPVTTAVRTYLVDSNFKITLISTRKLRVNKRMII